MPIGNLGNNNISNNLIAAAGSPSITNRRRDKGEW